MTTGPAINLLPSPIDISLGEDSTSLLPQCTANLMPFSIDYDGPAPIDSFLVQRPASSSPSDPADTLPEDGASESYISAFRGRAIQSTPLPLPSGYAAKIVSVSQVVCQTASASNAGSNFDAEIRKDEVEREKKRSKIANQPPARQQKFSMDSDDDDDSEEQENDQDDQDETSIHDSSPPQSLTDNHSAAEEPRSQPAATGPTIHITPLAQVHPNQLTVWGPDGPIDRGDDSFFRTVGEWYSVVAPLLHA
ncbi:hypothetical protein [Sporisorium scitamineum]|uniref:Uncharacterized protein n=1 Tax=Sporisorium scitamineum TaxID=49012 RepID=A0A0F7S6L0_9BASI|nr:hypothetical protein [Sporisorium scitamineum]